MGTGNRLEPTAPTPALPVGRGGLGSSRHRKTGWAPAPPPGRGHRRQSSLGPRGLGIA